MTPTPGGTSRHEQGESMTNERIDHAREAARVLSVIPAGDDPAYVNAMSYAQVHATLALVEQQRIANLIEYARLVNSDPNQALDLTAEIAAALGVDR